MADRLNRACDAVIACLVLLLTLPLLLLVALAIKCDSPGPILEREPSIGCGRRRFLLLKFRTRRHDLVRPASAQNPTNIAPFLQCTRIEDLPQLINVLRGEMGIFDRRRRSPFFVQ